MINILTDPISAFLVTTSIAVFISWVFHRYGSLFHRISRRRYKRNVLSRIVKMFRVLRASRNGYSAWEASECLLRIVFHLILSFPVGAIIYMKLVQFDPSSNPSFDWWTIAPPLLLLIICFYEVFYYVGVFYWKMATATDPEGMIKGLRDELLGHRGDILHPHERDAFLEYLQSFDFGLEDKSKQSELQTKFSLLQATISEERRGVPPDRLKG